MSQKNTALYVSGNIEIQKKLPPSSTANGKKPIGSIFSTINKSSYSAAASLAQRNSW
jgi:hypothetical protein